MDIDAEREAFDEWLPNYYTDGEDSAARAGWVAAIKHAESHPVIPEGYALVPIEPTPAMLDVAVSFALNVTLSNENTWPAYMRDVWLRMATAAQQAAQ